MYTTRSHSRVWVVLLILLALAAVGANWFFHLHNGEPSLASSTAANSAPDDDLRVFCFGHVDVEFGVRRLYPLQNGRVVEVLVHEGDTVSADAPILRIDDKNARFIVEQAVADWKAAQALLVEAKKGPAQHQLKVAQQKSAIEAAQKRVAAARLVQVRKQGLVQAQQLAPEEAAAAGELVKEAEAGVRAEEDKLKELQLDDPQIAITRATEDVAAKQSRHEQAKQALAECTLRAPSAGSVLRILVGTGDVLGPQPQQPAVQFCPDTPRFVRAEVTQEFADRVQLGAAAEIQNDSAIQETWRGQVAHISDWYTHRRSILLEPLQINDVRTLECIIRVEPGQRPLRIGQRVRVIVGGTAGND